MKPDNDIKWDIEAKAARDLSREQQQKMDAWGKEAHRALQSAGRAYKHWKAKMLRRSGITKDELIDAILDLRNQISAAIKTERLEDWLKFTLDMLDAKITQIYTADVLEAALAKARAKAGSAQATNTGQPSPSPSPADTSGGSPAGPTNPDGRSG